MDMQIAQITLAIYHGFFHPVKLGHYIKQNSHIVG